MLTDRQIGYPFKRVAGPRKSPVRASFFYATQQIRLFGGLSFGAKIAEPEGKPTGRKLDTLGGWKPAKGARTFVAESCGDL
jgi:hypothetical protein